MSDRRSRAPYTRRIVKLPAQTLSDAILHMGKPLLERLGPTPAPDDARSAIELTIRLWNAHAQASGLWSRPKTGPLAQLRRTMCGRTAPPDLAQSFELLSERWRSEFALDPRLVGAWSFEASADGTRELVCETLLHRGLEAATSPPLEKRIAIAGVFLDEVRIHLGESSFLLFPVERHRGEVHDDGVAAIHTPMATAAQLFADGRLTPVGGAPVEISIGGKNLGSMVLDSLRCQDPSGHTDVASLFFRSQTSTIRA